MYWEIIASRYHMAHNISHLSSEDYLIHSHPFYEFYYFISGDVYVLYDGTEYMMQPNTLAIFVPDVFHGIHVRSTDAYERYTAHFTEELIAPERRATLMGCLPTEAKLRSGAGGPPHIIRGAEKLGILPLLRQFERLDGFEEASREALVGTLMEAILTQYLLHTAGEEWLQSAQPFHAGDRELTPILSFIHQNLTERFTLDDLSGRFHISKGKLNTLFRRKMGVTTMEYVNRQRLNYARQLLINGVTAAQAGSAAGFGDYSNFYRAYKRQTGRSPGDDRRPTEGNAQQRLRFEAATSAQTPTSAADGGDIWSVNRATQVTTIDIGTLRDP